MLQGLQRRKKRARKPPPVLAKIHDSETNHLQAGVDEAGRGGLLGPVFTSAVILNPEIPLHKWLNDSKKVTPLRRAEVRKWIEETALYWSVAYVDNDGIEQMRIGHAVMKAMNDAIENLGVTPSLLLIDGDRFIPSEKNKDIPFETIVEGDSKYANIASASILAKENHNQFIRELIAREPILNVHYGLSTNMGYGTATHCNGIREHGATKYHRMYFLGNILGDGKKKTKNGKKILQILFVDSD